MSDKFTMTPSPLQKTPAEINQLYDGGPTLPTRFPEPPEHPLASKLFRDFRRGSAVMGRIEAYQVGNELNSQLARICELQAQLDEALRMGAALRQQVLSSLGVEGLP